MDISPASRIVAGKTEKIKWRPSGRNAGQRGEAASPEFASGTIFFSACDGVPPAAAMRSKGDVGLGVYKMTPFAPQVPPRDWGASARVCTAPPLASMMRSFPWAKNPRLRLSGDQKGRAGIIRACQGLSRGRIERTHPKLRRHAGDCRHKCELGAIGRERNAQGVKRVLIGRQNTYSQRPRRHGGAQEKANRKYNRGCTRDGSDQPCEPMRDSSSCYHRRRNTSLRAGFGNPLQLQLNIMRALNAVFALLGMQERTSRSSAGGVMGAT